MKNIQLTGIGNALVDLEYQVSEEELVNFGVDKGAMTLTEPDRQHEMIGAGDRETTPKFWWFGGELHHCLRTVRWEGGLYEFPWQRRFRKTSTHLSSVTSVSRFAHVNMKVVPPVRVS